MYSLSAVHFYRPQKDGINQFGEKLTESFPLKVNTAHKLGPRKTGRKGEFLMLQSIFVMFIRLYQYTISPLLGDICRFRPTCSEYAIASIQKHGIFKGFWFALKRICRCRPGKDGGFDPP